MVQGLGFRVQGLLFKLFRLVLRLYCGVSAICLSAVQLWIFVIHKP